MILLFKYTIQLGEPKKFPLFKWQYRAEARTGAGAGAKIMEKVELEPNLNNLAP